MSPPVVRWRFSPATTHSLRVLVYAAVGLTVGPFLAFLVLVGATLVRSGGVEVALLVLAIALVVGFGVGSGRALFALGNVPPDLHETTRALSRRWVVVSVLLGAGVGLGGLLRTDVGFYLVVGSIVAGFGVLVVGAGLRSEGVVDGEERTVEYGGRTIPLDAVRRLYARAVGPFVFALFSYHDGDVGPSTPRVLVLSREGLAAVEAVRASRERPLPDTEEERSTPAAVRVVAGVFGLACLLSGPLLWLVLPADGRLVGAYLGLFGLLFGALFVRYAVVA